MWDALIQGIADGVVDPSSPATTLPIGRIREGGRVRHGPLRPSSASRPSLASSSISSSTKHKAIDLPRLIAPPYHRARPPPPPGTAGTLFPPAHPPDVTLIDPGSRVDRRFRRLPNPRSFKTTPFSWLGNSKGRAVRTIVSRPRQSGPSPPLGKPGRATWSRPLGIYFPRQFRKQGVMFTILLVILILFPDRRHPSLATQPQFGVMAPAAASAPSSSSSLVLYLLPRCLRSLLKYWGVSRLRRFLGCARPRRGSSKHAGRARPRPPTPAIPLRPPRRSKRSTAQKAGANPPGEGILGHLAALARSLQPYEGGCASLAPLPIMAQAGLAATYPNISTGSRAGLHCKTTTS